MLIKVYHPVKDDRIVNRHVLKVYYVSVTELQATEMMGN